MPEEEEFDCVIQLKVSRAEKDGLEEAAERIGVSVEDLFLTSIELTEVLFDEDLRFSDVLRSYPVLKAAIAERRADDQHPEEQTPE